MTTDYSPIRHQLNTAYRIDETECVTSLLKQTDFYQQHETSIAKRAEQLVLSVRERRQKLGGLDAFIAQYDLSSQEGITLMCLAESALRIPDAHTVNQLIRDKIGTAEWVDHLGKSPSTFVNAMTWSLMLTGKMLAPNEANKTSLTGSLKNLVARAGMPVIRVAVNQMIKIMSEQFVMGQTIEDATQRAKESEAMGYRYSYDMLGEAARTQADAENYFAAYQHAIAALAKIATSKNPLENPGISVKLSALHPRYEFAKRERVLRELTPQLLTLVHAAKAANINLTIDAEEADRLDLSLDIIEIVLKDPIIKGWNGVGLAVQAYQKRAPYVLDWLISVATEQQIKIPVRLVKGAYWDSEIKRSQMQGLVSYPVFTRKVSTDVSYLVCAKKMADHPHVFYPQFATHNAYTLAAILELMQGRTDYELQALHGMGRTLYDPLIQDKNLNIHCRIYAPVGGYKDLLAYLVRRLLENGANTSFVNRIADENAPIADLIASPIAQVKKLTSIPHPHIPLPKQIFGQARFNSSGIDLSNREIFEQLEFDLDSALANNYLVTPLIGKSIKSDESAHKLSNPTDNRVSLGSLVEASAEIVDLALERSHAAFTAWQNTSVEHRARLLEKTADLLEERTAQFMALAIQEAGKTIPDALGEVREAIDFCRYYAEQARITLAPQIMPGYTGEFNELAMVGRGIVACISPWNFPLAIFLGQVSAALMAGNTVIAKPAEQTPCIAYEAVKLMYDAGIPDDVLQLLPGRGEIVGAKLVADLRVQGVIFTGSTETARLINQSLAKREGNIVPLIAETGGQNAMIVDSSALPEQVVQDVIISAFGSAGQRCSALRVLLLQEDIADNVIKMLQGAMAELVVSDPRDLKTDIGPVIDEEARLMLQQHVNKLQSLGKLIATVKVDEHVKAGHFFAPTAYEIPTVACLTREVFGPILHVIRFKARDLIQVVDEINATGYGLTFGIHSRINETIEAVTQRVAVGNCYVNRSMIGAVVGVQPFGGCGLSGTGPKAGGPHYLTRLCNERTLTIDTTAAGGNASLLSLGDE